jgi:hypothetical protein
MCCSNPDMGKRFASSSKHPTGSEDKPSPYSMATGTSAPMTRGPPLTSI